MSADHTTIPPCPAEDCTRGLVIADDWAAPNRDCEVCCGTGLAITAEDVVAGRVRLMYQRKLTKDWWEGQAKRLVDELGRVTAERDAARDALALVSPCQKAALASNDLCACHQCKAFRAAQGVLNTGEETLHDLLVGAGVVPVVLAIAYEASAKGGKS